MNEIVTEGLTKKTIKDFIKNIEADSASRLSFRRDKLQQDDFKYPYIMGDERNEYVANKALRRSRIPVTPLNIRKVVWWHKRKKAAFLKSLSNKH